MPTLQRPGVTLHYEEYGSGPPILLIAPGGMRSAISAWDSAPWNPIEHLADRYRLIAMDQRNAGSSVAEVHGSDGWPTYTADQLALLDHLGVDECAVLGMCIGGAYIANLLVTAPERVRAAVALQPIGRDGNQHRFEEIFDTWRDGLAAGHPEASEDDWASFRTNMYGGGGMLFSVPDEALARVTTPWLVLMGGDEYHPESVSRRLADLAPGAELVERWKAGEYVPAGRAAVDGFLAEHLPV
ncbi:alpha/beta hydrolase fold [Pseudonocardia ammonioxydans]|uniref:Alpha/beta hydrolase fold n=1 Tax=Pseudonocardia ammonioxydans TaxID=260086 RepID=A0A1I4X914_PSUAM|nr:alpha/beta hydrolase [Pseudonocardia ammonioxydans]SFN21946.1 alpha/beta hydrolase fold [Pseudonocardia ammonioxydans]